MTKTIALLCATFIAALMPSIANAQQTRPATAADFVGVFRLLDYPIEQQPKVLKEPPWTSSCQFFGHYPDGYWLHQQSQGTTCANAIPFKKPALPQTVQGSTVRPTSRAST